MSDPDACSGCGNFHGYPHAADCSRDKEQEIDALTAERDALRRQLEDLELECANVAIEANADRKALGERLAEARAALEIVRTTDICSERVTACERCKTNATIARGALAKIGER